jgi:hypothetical protein
MCFSRLEQKLWGKWVVLIAEFVIKGCLEELPEARYII